MQKKVDSNTDECVVGVTCGAEMADDPEAQWTRCDISAVDPASI
jgi:hypothetical protein